MFRFLWFGHGPKRSIFVSWDDVCRPKDEGGLGIRRPKDSNLASIIKLLWELETNSDALWVQWMRKQYLMGSSICCARPPQIGSWAWHGILSVPHLASGLLIYNLGDGSATCFLLNPWLGQPPLLLRFGDRFRQDLAISLTCKVGTFINSRSWALPPPTIVEMHDLWPEILTTPIGNGSDTISWKPNVEGFSLLSAWNSI